MFKKIGKFFSKTFKNIGRALSVFFSVVSIINFWNPLGWVTYAIAAAVAFFTIGFSLDWLEKIIVVVGFIHSVGNAYNALFGETAINFASIGLDFLDTMLTATQVEWMAAHSLWLFMGFTAVSGFLTVAAVRAINDGTTLTAGISSTVGNVVDWVVDTTVDIVDKVGGGIGNGIGKFFRSSGAINALLIAGGIYLGYRLLNNSKH